jgi:hypothetical protein
MKRSVLLLMLFCFCFGCGLMKPRQKDPEFPGLDRYEFEKTVEVRETLKAANTEKITVRFDGLTLREGLTLLTDQTGVSIVWSESLDNSKLYGSYFRESLGLVLESIARRVGSSVTEIDGIYYLGETNRNDFVSAVVRMIPVENETLITALSQGVSDQGRIAVIGGSLYIPDTFERVRKLLDDLEKMRQQAEHAYIAEVFFIRVKEDDFIKVTGDLQIRQVDVFASTANLDGLFQMFVDAGAGKSFASVEQRPVLYLSEGREANFEVGSELIREKKTVLENGVVQTSGYERFNDGLKLSLSLIRVSCENYAVDFDLEVSTFDTSKNSTEIPAADKSRLSLPGLLVNDSKIYYIGSLKRKDSRRGFSLFGIDTAGTNDLLTVWFRVRELKR